MIIIVWREFPKIFFLGDQILFQNIVVVPSIRRLAKGVVHPHCRLP